MKFRAVPRRSVALLALLLPFAPTLTNAAPVADDPHGGGWPGRCVRALSPGTQTIQVDNYPVRVHVPANIPARQSLPIVLNLHFSNGNADQQAAYSGLEPVGDQEGFVTVEPNGNIPAATPNPNSIWFWNVPGVPTTAGSYPPTLPCPFPPRRTPISVLGHGLN